MRDRPRGGSSQFEEGEIDDRRSLARPYPEQAPSRNAVSLFIKCGTEIWF